MDLVAASDRGQIMHSVRVDRVIGQEPSDNNDKLSCSKVINRLEFFKYYYSSSTWVSTF